MQRQKLNWAEVGLVGGFRKESLETLIPKLDAMFADIYARLPADLDAGALATTVQQIGQTIGAMPPTSFLSGNYTLATLPDPTQNLRKYAWVTDLFDGNPDYVISNGAVWKPVRPLAVNTVANANANMSLSALANAPTQILAGTLSAQRTVTLTTTLAYSGARFRIKREAGGLVSLLVNSVSTLVGTLSASTWADFEFDGTAWKQTASGGLL